MIGKSVKEKMQIIEGSLNPEQRKTYREACRLYKESYERGVPLEELRLTIRTFKCYVKEMPGEGDACAYPAFLDLAVKYHHLKIEEATRTMGEAKKLSKRIFSSEVETAAITVLPIIKSEKQIQRSNSFVKYCQEKLDKYKTLS
jgi:hypothetical protein